MPAAKDSGTIGSEVPIEFKKKLAERAAIEQRTMSALVFRGMRFFLEYAEIEKSTDPIPKLKVRK